MTDINKQKLHRKLSKRKTGGTNYQIVKLKKLQEFISFSGIWSQIMMSVPNRMNDAKL